MHTLSHIVVCTLSHISHISAGPPQKRGWDGLPPHAGGGQIVARLPPFKVHLKKQSTSATAKARGCVGCAGSLLSAGAGGKRQGWKRDASMRARGRVNRCTRCGSPAGFSRKGAPRVRPVQRGAAHDTWRLPPATVVGRCDRWSTRQCRTNAGLDAKASRRTELMVPRRTERSLRVIGLAARRGQHGVGRGRAAPRHSHARRGVRGVPWRAVRCLTSAQPATRRCRAASLRAPSARCTGACPLRCGTTAAGAPGSRPARLAAPLGSVGPASPEGMPARQEQDTPCHHGGVRAGKWMGEARTCDRKSGPESD